ncbi:hypothetical protein ONZ51_g1887 [Trametes cubensis]|uniref:Uncharacterized protein n=1 Tax=Trametes cubensis TaxID=1111947 RepID=A0AAD7XF24_9APHY|nr:hypothetical protein ONZ51_g1887 [Trametes cubensis]
MSKQLRIAIALAALRHKPPTQPIQAYISDLQSVFTVICTCRPCQVASLSTDSKSEHISALETEIEDLRTKHDEDKLELLALRKAAKSHLNRSVPDSAHDADTTPSTTGKKGKAKKAKPATSSAATAAPLSTPVAVTVPPRVPKLGLIAVLRGDFTDSLPALRGYSSPARISSALEAADTLVDMLTADAMAVPVDLVLSTTMRALKAIETVFLGLVARYRLPSGLNCSGADLPPSGLLPGTRAASISKCDLASVLEALTASVCSLVSAVLSALFVKRATKAKQATKKKIGVARARAAHAAAVSSAAAIDDVLGGLYAHILGPALHAFATLSEGHLTTCFTGDSNNTIGDELTNLPDLRSDVFVLFGDVLTVLENTFSEHEPTSIPASPPAAPSATGPPRPTARATIPGSSDVKTILSLECVRELEKLFVPPDPARLRSRTDESASPNAAARAPHGYAQDDPPSSDSPWQAYSRPGTTPTTGSSRARLANTSDSASTSGAVPPAAPASASLLSSAPCARPGTASGSALSSLGVGAGAPVGASVGRGAPRAPRNLGETYSGTSSGPGCGPVSADHPSMLASLPGSKEVEAATGQGQGRVRVRPSVRNSVRAGAVASDIVSVLRSVDGNPQAKRKRQRRETGTDAADLGARIAKLARKDTVWWLCAVLDRLLPSLPAPLSASTSASPHASQLNAMSLEPASGDHGTSATCTPAASTSTQAAPTACCVEVAYEAVYNALADLLRRTRPRSRLGHVPPAAAAAEARPSSPSLRGLSSSTSNHARAGPSRTSGPRRKSSSAEEGLAEMQVEDADIDVPVDLAIRGGSAGNSKLGETGAKDARKAAAHGERMEPREVLGETVDQRAGQGGAQMGEVERGLLLAVLERAWLGV